MNIPSDFKRLPNDTEFAIFSDSAGMPDQHSSSFRKRHCVDFWFGRKKDGLLFESKKKRPRHTRGEASRAHRNESLRHWFWWYERASQATGRHSGSSVEWDRNHSESRSKVGTDRSYRLGSIALTLIDLLQNTAPGRLSRLNTRNEILRIRKCILVEPLFCSFSRSLAAPL